MDLMQMQLAAKLLDAAADEFGNHGSNDMDQSYFKDWTDAQKMALAYDFYQWNGGREEIEEYENAVDDAERLRQFRRIGDSSWMSYFAAQLKRGVIQLSFPIRVLPHYGLPESRIVVSAPDELGAAVVAGFDASPVNDVSIELQS